jgi:hypothetical protein
MSKNKSKPDKFGKNRFQSKSSNLDERPKGNREEKPIKEEYPKLLFSFKDFDNNQIPPGQLYSEWQEKKILAYMIEKFGHICELNRTEAIQGGYLKVYGSFPNNSQFEYPKHIEDDVSWAVIMNIKGQKPRVAGHIIENVFYVVFLDIEHVFFPSSKKNT